MNLSKAEQKLIIAALEACAPTGGGSDAFHLARKLMNGWQVIPEDTMVGQLQTVAYTEYAEWHGTPQGWAIAG